MRASFDRDDADGCMHLLPRVRRLRGTVAPEVRRLLRVLFLRFGSLSTDPGRPITLRESGQSVGEVLMGCESLAFCLFSQDISIPPNSRRRGLDRRSRPSSDGYLFPLGYPTQRHLRAPRSTYDVAGFA